MTTTSCIIDTFTHKAIPAGQPHSAAPALYDGLAVLHAPGVCNQANGGDAELVAIDDLELAARSWRPCDKCATQLNITVR